jgi:hypothetical protein
MVESLTVTGHESVASYVQLHVSSSSLGPNIGSQSYLSHAVTQPNSPISQPCYWQYAISAAIL